MKHRSETFFIYFSTYIGDNLPEIFLLFVVDSPTCKSKIDVGFILDSSGSLKTEYHKEKDFLKALAGAFDMGPDGSRAGNYLYFPFIRFFSG